LISEDAAALSRQPQRLIDVLNKNWYQDASRGTAWVRGYTVQRVPSPDSPLDEGTALIDPLIDLHDTRAAIVHGQVEYWPNDSVTFSFDYNGNLRAEGELQPVRAPGGTYLLLLTAHDKGDGLQDEPATVARLDAAAGLLVANFGGNVVYEHLYDNIIHLNQDRVELATPAVVNPMSMRAPDLADPSIQRACDMARLIDQHEQHGRFKLALRWYLGAANEFDDVDALLKYWIGLETLAMPDQTNIRPVNERLGAIYGMSHDRAAARFRVGPIFGLRGRIVHDGERPSIGQYLRAYLDDLFVDLLADAVGLPSEGRASARLDAHDHENTWLP
jgi:hypothetical protein